MEAETYTKDEERQEVVERLRFDCLALAAAKSDSQGRDADQIVANAKKFEAFVLAAKEA